MGRLTFARIVVAGIGVVIWGYGYSADNENVRLAGIVILAASLALRLVKRRKPHDPDAV